MSTTTANYNDFFVQIASGSGSVPYATFMGGADSSSSSAQGLAVETIGGVIYAYLAGWTYSSTFPVSTGVYHGTLSGSGGSKYNGWMAAFNPAASGSASLDDSTYLGTTNSQLLALAADSSGNTYVTGIATTSTYPVTPGSFQYKVYCYGSGGVYVTRLNPTGTALVYSSYLGYGTGYGIAVDGQATPSAYVTGSVGHPDFQQRLARIRPSMRGTL